MSSFDPTNPREDDLVDRIVDGVLTPAELRTAIERLDREPDGWKRCTLAFVEAQCWRESLQSLGELAITRPVGSSLPLPSGRPTHPVRRWIRGPIAAAIVAASFALGWLSHMPGPGSRDEPTSIARAGAKPGVVRSGSQAASAEIREIDQDATPGLASGRTVQRASLPTVNEVVRAVARLHVGTKSTGADVPILAGPGINEDWLKRQPPPVTEAGQVALARAGYQVNQRRRFIMKTLADGRRVAVPVDQVQIRYTGNDPL